MSALVLILLVTAVALWAPAWTGRARMRRRWALEEAEAEEFVRELRRWNVIGPGVPPVAFTFGGLDVVTSRHVPADTAYLIRREVGLGYLVMHPEAAVKITGVAG